MMIDIKADEMFEKLGYIKYVNHSKNIEFYKYIQGFSEEVLKLIVFDIKNKEIHTNTTLTFNELQAINKMVEELGWIDENRKLYR